MTRIEVYPQALHVLAPIRLAPAMRERLLAGERAEPDCTDPALLRLILPMRAVRRGGRTAVVAATACGPQPDPNLIRALRAAHALLERDGQGRPVLDVAPASTHRRRLARLAFLAPELQRAILDGRQPPGLTLKRLMQSPMPASWAEQLRTFGRPASV